MKDIWIADDDQSIRFVLEKALAREQLAVRSFSNARDVLAALEEDEPQVLVSDIRMPGMSGVELLGKIKAAGVQVNEVDKDAFVKASGPIYEEFGKEVAGAKEAIDKSVALGK